MDKCYFVQVAVMIICLVVIAKAGDTQTTRKLLQGPRKPSFVTLRPYVRSSGPFRAINRFSGVGRLPGKKLLTSTPSLGGRFSTSSMGTAEMQPTSASSFSQGGGLRSNISIASSSSTIGDVYDNGSQDAILEARLSSQNSTATPLAQRYGKTGSTTGSSAGAVAGDALETGVAGEPRDVETIAYGPQGAGLRKELVPEGTPQVKP